MFIRLVLIWFLSFVNIQAIYNRRQHKTLLPGSALLLTHHSAVSLKLHSHYWCLEMVSSVCSITNILLLWQKTPFWRGNMPLKTYMLIFSNRFQIFVLSNGANFQTQIATGSYKIPNCHRFDLKWPFQVKLDHTWGHITPVCVYFVGLIILHLAISMETYYCILRYPLHHISPISIFWKEEGTIS